MIYDRRNDRRENMVGVTSPTKLCSECRHIKALAGGKFKRGTSRHNPGRWLCAACKEKEEAK